MTLPFPKQQCHFLFRGLGRTCQWLFLQASLFLQSRLDHYSFPVSGNSFHSLSSSNLSNAFGRMPERCLMKNATRRFRHYWIVWSSSSFWSGSSGCFLGG